MNPTFLFQDEYLEREENREKEREKSHLPFSHCERIIRDQIKNLFRWRMEAKGEISCS
jgi:histone H3/H4